MKHFVHIRNFAFFPSNLKCSHGDVVIFVHDGDDDESHSICIPGKASSPLLSKGSKWEFNILESFPHNSKLCVVDGLFSFMKLFIRINVMNTSLSPLKPIKSTERYADSFVYAAANNQVSIVKRRLGLDKFTGRKITDSVDQALPIISDPNVMDSDGFSALGAATRSGHVDVVTLLLDNGANICATNKGGDTALHLAANWGKTDIIALLLQHGAKVHCVNDLLRTPLHLATFNGHQGAVATLLKEGEPDPYMGDYSGKTPFEIATDFATSRLEIALTLKDYAKEVYAPNITSILMSVDRERDAQDEDGEEEDDEASEESPFEYLPRLGYGALSLVAQFLVAEQRTAIAALISTQKRLGIQTRGIKLTSMSSNNARFEVFSPVRSFDPRSRSLPYLLRQAENALASEPVSENNTTVE